MVQWREDATERGHSTMAATVSMLDPRARALVEDAASVLRNHGATEVYVYGSVVGGAWDPDRSDIDFAVRGIPPERYFRAAADVVDRIGREVDLTDLDSGGRFGPMLERRGKLIRVG